MKNYCLLFILSCLLFSCNAIRVSYDYEKNTDFTQYKTYNYFSDIESGLSELDEKRLLDALDVALQNQGFTFASSPDFFIDIQSSEYHQANQSNVGVGVGGTGRNVGGGISIGIPVGQNSLNRVIQFDFVDENGVGLFWQAVSESSYNPNAKPDQRETQLKAIVAKVLEGFPPKK